jgi:hypothetical protein
MWRALLPWIEAFLSLLGFTAILSIQPIAVPLFALLVFLFAYFGIPEVKAFVNTHPNTLYAVGGVTFLAPWGIRLGVVGILLSLIALAVAAYITVHELAMVS